MSNTPSDSEPDRSTEANRDTLNPNRDTLDTDTMQWLSGFVALLGLYIAVSPFIFEATVIATWNDLVVGTAIFVLAGYNFYRLFDGQLASVGAAALVMLLGLWALMAPFVIEMGSDELATGTAFSGVLVAALSAYNAYVNREADMPERTTVRT